MRVAPLLVPFLVAGCTALDAATWGGELRAYPAGVIPAFVAEAPLSARGALVLGAGVNLTDRQDFGEHDDEQGEGYGVGVGYRHVLSETPAHWFVGGRVDFWSLSIDFEDPGVRGETDVLVLQPTVELGYRFQPGPAGRLAAFLALGAEVNVDTDGEDVGEGAIGLVGVSWLFGR